MKNSARLAVSIALAAGHCSAIAQECAVPATTSSGFAFLIQERTDAVNLCPAVVVDPYWQEMAFAWGSATVQFLAGSPWVAASPAQGDLPAQIWFRRFDSTGTALDSVPRPIVDYSGDTAWGHQYPSLAIEQPPAASFLNPPTPQMALTFQADFSGFSKIAPSADSRLIYASRNGNSNNSGYSPDSPLPLADGLALLRDGYPDQLLLERDPFSQAFQLSTPIGWTLSGRSIDEPIVLGAYGEGPRPVLAISGDQSVIFSSGSSPLSHLRFIGLELQAPGYNGCGQQNSEATGIVVVRPGSDLWIEDCLFRKLGSAVELQGHSNNSRERNIVRRSTFWEISRSTWDSNRCSNDNGGSCIFQDHYDTSIIEDSFFGFSGATPPDSCGGSTEQALSNAMYNAEGNPGSQAVRNCITFNTGRSGFNCRTGGLIQRNASIRNAQSFPVGNASNPSNIATLKYNLCIESRDHQGFKWIPCHPNPPQTCIPHPCNSQNMGYWESPEKLLGHGFVLDRLFRADVIQNIVCNATDGQSFGGGYVNALQFKGGSSPDEADVSQNIVYQWINYPAPPSWGGETFSAGVLPGNVDWQLFQNEVMQADNHRLVEARNCELPVPGGGIGFDQNSWHSARSNTTAPWFWEHRNGNHSGITNATWTSTVESTAIYGQIAYTDPDRTVASYAVSIGLSNSTDSFIQALAAREHSQWDHELSAYGLIDYIRDGFDLPELGRLPGPNCTGHFANMYSSFAFDASSFPRVGDDAPSICNKGRASISMVVSTPLRVGGGIDRQGIWYAWGAGSANVLDSSTNLATTPCVSGTVAVWFVQNGSTWDLKAARLVHQQITPSVFTLKSGLNPPPQAGNAPVQYGAWEPVIPPSVASFDDGSFAVSYSDGQHRWVSLYSGSTPALQKDIHVDTGFAQFNHSVAVWGPYYSHSQARVSFVGVSQPDSGEPWAPYVRTYMPNYGGCRMSRPHHIPKVSPHTGNLALGPAFAHPISIRPDGSLVVTWWRQFASQGQTNTTLGASVFETAGTYCPADLNCDGTVDSADVSIFNAWMLAGNMLADFNCDGQLNSVDVSAFNTLYNVGCQ